ncbi:MAG: glucose-1-phosphate cytidylyltransferase [Bacteriovorax sp.]
MQVVILAGGLGTRLSEETSLKPKPMVEIGGQPMLWHIMKTYAHYGHKDFIVCLGYKGHIVKEYFANFFLYQSDVSIDLKNNKIEIHNTASEDWTVTLVDTGPETQTGARIKKIEKYIKGENFMLTYGDGLSNVNINELLAFHQKNGKIGTMTSIQPEGRFGALDIDANGQVTKFIEKPKGDGNWINGGFFILNKEFFNYLSQQEDLILEKEPLEGLVKNGQLMTFRHHGFWKCMDTLRDKTQLENMWQSGKAPWKVW